MKTITFDNIVDHKTGKKITIEVPDSYEMPKELIERAREFGERFIEASKKDLGN